MRARILYRDARTNRGNRGENVADEPKESDGVDYDDGRRKLSVSGTAWSQLLGVIGGDLRWVVRAVGWGIACIATCYGVSLL